MISETGASRAILILAEVGLFKLVVCPHVLQEVERNLAAKLPQALPLFRRMLERLSVEVVPDPPREEVSRWAQVIVPKDAPVLAAAVLAAPHRLVTLDVKDFLTSPEVTRRSGLVICTPGEVIQDVRTLLEAGFSR